MLVTASNGTTPTPIEFPSGFGIVRVGLRGRIGAGKTTLAKHFASRRPLYDVTDNFFISRSASKKAQDKPQDFSVERTSPKWVMRLSFAGPIKQTLFTLGITKEKTPDLYRKLAQVLGQGARDVNPYFWVDKWYDRILEFLPEQTPDIVIADDCRYENEGADCDIVAWVERTDRPPSVEADQHLSEAWAIKEPGGHIILHNDGTPEALDRMAAELLSFIRQFISLALLDQKEGTFSRTGALPWQRLHDQS